MMEGVQQQEPAEPRIISLLRSSSKLTSDLNDFLEQSSSQPRLYLQRGPPTGLNPLFTVKVPLLGFQYVLDSRVGLTQWFIEPIDMVTAEILDEDFTIDSGRTHQFFARELVPVPWAVENILVWLQRAYFSLPCQNSTISEDRRNHYIVNVLLAVGDDPHDTRTRFTRHFISGDTELRELFEALRGDRVLEGDCVLAQYTWAGENFPLAHCHLYSEVVYEQITFRDAGYVGKFLWLLPVKPITDEDEQSGDISEMSSAA